MLLFPLLMKQTIGFQLQPEHGHVHTILGEKMATICHFSS